MSLDITFYGKNGQETATIEFDENFYQWLAKSDFSEIGTPHPKTLIIDEEEDEHDVVELDKGTISNRKRLIDFFKEEICQETPKMLKNLGESPSKEEYKQETQRLKKLIEILEYLENQNYHYLERVT